MTEQLAALRAVQPDQLPPALLDLSVRRIGEDYYVCPADWEQLRHEEGAQRFLSAARARLSLVSERGPDVSLHTLRFAGRGRGHI